MSQSYYAYRDLLIASVIGVIILGTEIYIVLQGLGSIAVGYKEQKIQKGSVIVTPPDTAHYTMPEKDLVLAVINTPPFGADNYVVVSETNQDVGFDQEQFKKLAEA